METRILNGWNISVKRGKIMVKAENGQPKEAESWILVFEENFPPSGNRITFEMGKDLRDYVVRELTGGVVLAGGELPEL